mmetsp:Transcript_31923/g.83653  ORF Transcript_31923/g.83653 Transcript_31923/m.83653 type:complete len:400 (-) Transcript_31923:60-1259(-)
MGGGDLNVKKSWHVSNFNNLEKVYLAEQRDAAEKRKIAELVKERAEQARIEDLQAHAVSTGAIKKKQERVEFLYQGHAPVDREAYILGKKIDKAVEIESKDDLDIGNAPGAAFAQGNANTAMDLSRKVRDDPLFAIKRKEQEGVRSVLNNPVRMKQLMELRDASRGKKAKKEKKGKKKHAREARDGRDRSSSPEGAEPPTRTTAAAAPHDSGRDRSPPRYRRDRSPPRYRRARSRSRSPSSRSRRRDRSPDEPRKRLRSRSPPRRTDGGPRGAQRDPPRGADRRGREGREPRPSTRSHRGHGDDEADRQRKLDEMRANASWHDRERAERAKEYAAKEAEQEARDSRRETDGFGRAAFMDDFNRDSYNSAAAGSVGDRLNRNRHFIQRTSAALDSQSFRR